MPKELKVKNKYKYDLKTHKASVKFEYLTDAGRRRWPTITVDPKGKTPDKVNELIAKDISKYIAIIEANADKSKKVKKKDYEYLVKKEHFRR